MPAITIDPSSTLWKRHALSLRFQSQTVESAYIQSRKDEMVTNLSRVAWLILFGCGTAAVPQLVEWPTSSASRRVNTVGECSSVLIGLALVLCPYLPLVQRRVSFRGWEAISVPLLVVLVVHTVHLDDKLYEADHMDHYERLWHCARVTLGLDAIVTVTHLCLPFRWFIMFWVDVFTLASFVGYSIIMLGDVLSYHTLRINILFFVFVAGASLGLRFQEKSNRQLFITIADERRLRAEAEFNIETQTPRERGPKQPKDDASSLPETTQSGIVFHQASSGSTSMDDLVNLGLQERWLIKQDDLDLSTSRLLGRGAYGEVVSGVFCRGPVAIKQVAAGEGEEARGSRSMYNELRILRHVRHPHIALFHGACVSVESGKILIVMEQIEGRPLDAVISQMQLWKQDSSPSAPKQAYMMQSVCQALVYLHAQSPRIVHGDLKPSNILAERRGNNLWPKLLDFGLSRTVTHNAEMRGGTPAYIAPEIVCTPKQRPHPSMDAFSFGRLLYFVACGRRPGGTLSAEAMLELILKGTPVTLTWLPSTALLRRWKGLIEACTAHEASERPSAEEAHDALNALGTAKDLMFTSEGATRSGTNSEATSSFGFRGTSSSSVLGLEARDACARRDLLVAL